MPAPRMPRIQARLAGPSGLAAALVLGAAGPASASVHRAAIAGPGPGWAPAAAAASSTVTTTTDSSLGAIAVLGACGLAGFLLLILGRRRDVDEPAESAPTPPDLEAILRRGSSGPGRGGGPNGPVGMGVGRYPAAIAAGIDGGPAPVWVKRLNDQAPPPPESDRVMDGAYRG